MITTKNTKIVQPRLSNPFNQLHVQNLSVQISKFKQRTPRVYI